MSTPLGYWIGRENSTNLVGSVPQVVVEESVTEGVAGWMLVAFHSRFAVETTDDVDSERDIWLCGVARGYLLSLYGDKGVDEALSGL